jgi:hypothetical protein
VRYLPGGKDSVAGTGFNSVVTDLEREAAFQHIEGLLFIVMDMAWHPATRLSHDFGDGNGPARGCCGYLGNNAMAEAGEVEDVSLAGGGYDRLHLPD